MGSRDKGRKETKKAKKVSKKTTIDSIIQPPMSVEVIRKKRDRDEE
ncbi:hypothetical protein ACFLUG_01920 [Chloroflexota bacterium]